MSSLPAAIPIRPALLRRWALPQPNESDDKEARGRVLVIGGSPETPGALILSATAGLRAGAGKLRIVAGERIALAIGVAVPESRVFAMRERQMAGLWPGAIVGLPNSQKAPARS